MTSDPPALWTSLADDELTETHIDTLLKPLPDHLWVAAACVDRLVDDVDVQRQILELGLQRTGTVLESCPPLAAVDNDPTGNEEATPPQVGIAELKTYFEDNQADAKLCHLRTVLLQRLDRLNTFVESCKVIPDGEDDESETEDEEWEEEESLEDWEDNPWGDDTNPHTAGNAEVKKQSSTPPIPLSAFLTDDLVRLACLCASKQWFEAIRCLWHRHGEQLWQYRFVILDNIPEYAQPQAYRHVLPEFDIDADKERRPPTAPHRATPDLVEDPNVVSAVQVCHPTQAAIWSAPFAANAALPSTELADWYKKRASAIADEAGLVDVALSIIQHGASQGLPGLDEFGEELSLFTRLIYDAPASPRTGDHEEWSLARWLTLTPPQVIQAYVAHSSPETIVRDIRDLVNPYLFVLESRADREGKSDPQISTNLLHEYILSAPIDLTVSIFEASKPTLPQGERLLRDDEDIARLALACLYGSNSLDRWPTMSRIFECLPAWDISQDEDADDDIADTTMASLGAFVTPSTSMPRCTPTDLLMFFKPLPLSSLSRALDILDVHLESGEIFSRWGSPAPLRWFLQSNGNEAEQRAWAHRIARRGAGSDEHMNTVEDWEWILEDMLKLCGKSDNGIRGALGLIPRKEVMRIVFAGLLGTGKFEVAKELLRARHAKFTLKPADIEEICISSSHEFYDNATSGNYKVGDMKLAYDCLCVPAQSDKVLQEKEFIEATSRLSSFNLTSRGNPISPIEIRMTKDRLSLVSRVLSSNADAYKHTEVILDLVYKLGFRAHPVAEIKTLSMISDAALLAEDFTRAYEVSERMVADTLRLRTEPNGADVQEASQVCWMTCYQLGRQPEFDDVQKKLTLLGRAMELCPAEQLNDILVAWRKLDKEDAEIRAERLGKRHRKKSTSATSRKPLQSIGQQLYHAHTPIHSLAARLQDFKMPTTPLLNTPDATALASKTFRTVAANFPFGTRGRPHEGSANGEEASPRPEHDVSAQASRALAKGIGWLIGDDHS